MDEYSTCFDRYILKETVANAELRSLGSTQYNNDVQTRGAGGPAGSGGRVRRRPAQHVGGGEIQRDADWQQRFLQGLPETVHQAAGTAEDVAAARPQCQPPLAG